jgi:membrane protease YdiL (CAAX protease family)
MDLTPPQLPSEDPTTITPPPSAQDSAQDPAQNSVFFGPFGLRALWSLLIYFAIVGGIIGGFYLIGHQVHQQSEHAATATATKTGKPAPPTKPIFAQPDAHEPMPLSYMISGELVMFAGIFLLSWFMSAIEHRNLSAFGLGGAHPIRRLLVGAFWGIAAISLLILALHTFHFLTFDSRLDHGRSILYWGVLQLFGFLLVGLTEEYAMRGYLQFTLTRGLVSIGNLISQKHARTIAFWIAALLTSTLFCLGHTHNAGENWLGLFQVFLAGVVFVVALWRTGSLWWGIGFHMAWDWGQSFLYGVPDSGGLEQGRLFATHAHGNPLFSGGTVGPEGSVLCIPIFLLTILVLCFTDPSLQPPLELPDATDPSWRRDPSPIPHLPDSDSAAA